MIKVSCMRLGLALLIVTAGSLYRTSQVAAQVTSAPPISFRIQIDKDAGRNLIPFASSPHDKTPVQTDASAKPKSRVTHSPDKSVVLRPVKSEKDDASVQLFDAANDKPLGPAITLKGRRITALAISPDNKTIATAIGNFSRDYGKVCIWNGVSGNVIAEYSASGSKARPHLGEVTSLAFSEDGNTLTVVSGEAGGK